MRLFRRFEISQSCVAFLPSRSSVAVCLGGGRFGDSFSVAFLF